MTDRLKEIENRLIGYEAWILTSQKNIVCADIRYLLGRVRELETGETKLREALKRLINDASAALL